MATTQSPGTCIAFRTIQPGKFRHAVSSPGSAGDGIFPSFMDLADNEMPDRSGKLSALTGIDISPEEFRELRVFDEFLEHHVQPNGICSVQCMMLWNEWVRTFRHRTHGFPKLILEKEFRSLITGMFGTGIAYDEFRGAVYPGIRFVP